MAEVWPPSAVLELVAMFERRAHRDEQGLYFGPDSLVALIRAAYKSRARDVSQSQAQNMATALVVFGLVEPGRRGSKLAGYKRRFWPERMHAALK